MNRRTVRVAKLLLERFGLTVTKLDSIRDDYFVELGPEQDAVWTSVSQQTMTSRRRVLALLGAIDYILDRKIEGDIVECGVWRGGNMMAAAMWLAHRSSLERQIWLYDTFAGMTSPTDQDTDIHGNSAARRWSERLRLDGGNEWCYASEETVRANMEALPYPLDRIKIVKGDVSSTLLESRPESISLLRLDTDWYESTKIELELLYPLLSHGGICIVDDYGHWRGSREAVDEYFHRLGGRPYMGQIDYTGRIFVKCV